MQRDCGQPLGEMGLAEAETRQSIENGLTSDKSSRRRGKKDEIDNLVQSLKSYREEMDTHILVSLTLGHAVFPPPSITQGTLQVRQLSTHSPEQYSIY